MKIIHPITDKKPIKAKTQIERKIKMKIIHPITDKKPIKAKTQIDLYAILRTIQKPFKIADKWLLEHSVLWCFWTLYAQVFVYPFKWFILGFFTLEFLFYDYIRSIV